MNVTVTLDDLTRSRNEGTIVVLTGRDEQGRRVTFAADQRAVAALVGAVLDDGQATAAVEDWQVLTAEILAEVPFRPMDGGQP